MLSKACMRAIPPLQVHQTKPKVAQRVFNQHPSDQYFMHHALCGCDDGKAYPHSDVQGLD